MALHNNTADFYAIVPAGGVGSRLWPLSRAGEPKFLLDVIGQGKSLLRSTWDRLEPLTGADRIAVVTGYGHRRAVRAQLPDLDSGMTFLEPNPKDSTAAICFAAAVIEKRHPGAIVGSFAADHSVEDDYEFRRTVVRAIETARAGYITTIGIKPTEASTSFGYIKAGELLPGVETGARSVPNFVEKPAARDAERYVSSGDYLWNAGIFVAPAALLLDELRQSRPLLAAHIDAIAEAWDSPEGFSVKDREWEGIEKVAIDYAIAEPAAGHGKVAVVPGDFGWDDVGDFASVAKHILAHNVGRLAILGDSPRVMSDNASGLVVGSTDRIIALIGIEDVVVVDTHDALLVTTKDHAQQVKSMVDALRLSGNDSVL